MSCDFIDGPTTTLVHSWTSVSPDTVKQLSGVCYIAIRDVKLVVGRPVGIITAYIGGTPVEAYANDSHLESKTCKMRIGRKGSNTPCLWLEDPLNANVTGGASIGTACPQGLFNMLIAPLVKWNLRAALWYQGEANSDEGYHRNAAEYECEFKALITTWRAAWGYSLPFFFVQLHPWGFGGGPVSGTAALATHGNDYGDGASAITNIRFGQAAALSLPDTGMAVAFDCCSLNPPNDPVWANSCTYSVENIPVKIDESSDFGSGFQFD